MPFLSRPNFENRQVVQYSGDTITLSGDTYINNTGIIQINAPILDFTGTTTASTQYIIAGVTGYNNYGQISSFIVQPPIILQSGTTGTTTVDVTGYFLGALDAEGRVTWLPAPSITGGTGGGGSFTGGSGNCISDFYTTNIHSCLPAPSPLHIQPLSTDPILMGEAGALVAMGTPNFTPLTVLHLLGDLSGSVDTFRIQNSAGAIQLNVTDIGIFDFNNGAGVILRSGTTFTYEDTPVAGYVLTSDSFGVGTWQPVPSGSGTTIIQFTGNTSASCITDLFVTNLNSCSPLYIQNKSFGDVVLVPNNNGNIAIGKFSATTKLDISGKTRTTEFQVTNSAVNGYVLTSDSVGNATWQPAPTGSGGTITSPYKFGSNVYDIVTLSGNNFTLSNQALVLGGDSNTADGIGATIINGQYNTLTGGTGTTIVNGYSHLITDSDGAIIGNGFLNSINSSKFSSIINGDSNLIDNTFFSSEYSFIGGGKDNSISNSKHSFIGAGSTNIISVFGVPGGWNTIINGDANTITTGIIQSTILGGFDNTIGNSYSAILGGQSNTINDVNTFILGSNISTTQQDTTYTENLIAGANSVNSYQGHLRVNNYNTVGPVRPNYVSDLLTSGNTTGGTYNIMIPSGWTVNDIQVYVKTTDTNAFGATVGTAGGIWDPGTFTAFSPSHNIITLFRTVPENGPHYFSSSDVATVNFVDAGAFPVALTNGEYKMLITYWDGNEIGIF